MVVVENFYPGYDGVSKKIINYHVIDSLSNAKKAVKEYIKRFFPKDEWKCFKEENKDIIVHRLERIGSNFGNARDVEYITIKKDVIPSSYEDMLHKFDEYQAAIDNLHKEILGETEYKFEMQ